MTVFGTFVLLLLCLFAIRHRAEEVRTKRTKRRWFDL